MTNLSSNSIENAYIRSKFSLIEGNLNFHRATSINDSNISAVINLFNHCFVTSSNRLDPWSVPAWHLSGDEESMATSQVQRNSPLSLVKTPIDLVMALNDVGIVTRAPQFYRRGYQAIEDIYEITDFSSSDLFLDPTSMDLFLKGLNNIIDLDGNYEIVNSASTPTGSRTQLAVSSNHRVKVSSVVRVYGRNRMGKSIHFEIILNEDSIACSLFENEKFKNRDLHTILRRLASDFFASSVTTQLFLESSELKQKFFYDSADGSSSLLSADEDELFQIDAIKKSLANSNLIANCLHLPIRWTS